MRTLSFAWTAMLATVALGVALGGCGDDTTATTGSGGNGGGGASTSSDASGSTGSGSPSSSSSTTANVGGGTGEGGTGEGGATGTGGNGGATGTGGDGGATGTGGAGPTEFVALWSDVAFDEDGGRLDLEAFTDLTLQVRVSGTEDVALELPSQILPAGFVVHAYAIGLVADDSLDAFVVQDNDEFTQPDAGDGNIRLAHFSPGLPAVDIYLVAENFDLYGPLLDTDTFDFPSMSRYGSFPSGTYEARIVLTGGDPFVDPIGIFSDVAITAGDSETIAIIGLGQDEASVELAVYQDDLTEPEAGSGAVTFVHTAPDAPNVDVGALFPIN